MTLHDDAAAAETEAEQRIRETFDQVVLWHRTPRFEPGPGSQLRADDAEWPWLAPSQLAKVGLDVAAEHLFAIQVLIKACRSPTGRFWAPSADRPLAVRSGA